MNERARTTKTVPATSAGNRDHRRAHGKSQCGLGGACWRSRAVSVSVVVAMVAGAWSCDSAKPPSAGSPSAATVSSSASPALAKSVAAASRRSPFAGLWRGAFKAERARVSVPEGVPWDVWAADDGKLGVGAGTISLKVAPDASVTGTLSGVLGSLQLRGGIENGVLRAGITPQTANDAAGMTGYLTAEITTKKLSGKLVVSNPAGAVAREASFSLSRAR